MLRTVGISTSRKHRMAIIGMQIRPIAVNYYRAICCLSCNITLTLKSCRAIIKAYGKFIKISKTNFIIFRCALFMHNLKFFLCFKIYLRGSIMNKKTLSHTADWDFQLLESYEKEIAEIASSYKLETYPNQIEIITAEQMIDAYSRIGMPLGYSH